MARKLGISAKIKFLGEQPHAVVRDVMATASVYVQHSVTADDGDMEGLPNSILEAMACGLPVVSTWHSGIPEAVVHGTTGLLVPEHDVEAMAVAIVELFDDTDRAAAIGMAGRERVLDRFSDVQAAETMRLIMGLTEGDDRRRPNGEDESWHHVRTGGIQR
jgi:glycosyltransferase involved in cell wall biosynthesis